MKTDVYSWRVSSDLKSDLERKARERKVPVSHILDSAVRHWLKQSEGDSMDEEKIQRKLHASVETCIGSLALGNSRGAQSARETIRQRLKERYARERAD